jgi:hypothetical protein
MYPRIIAFFVWCVAYLSICAAPLKAQETALPRVVIRNAETLRLPGGRQPEAGIEDAIDSNCPVEWDSNGQMMVFASVTHPFRSTGPNLFSLASPSVETVIERRPELTGGVWLEATYRDETGVLFAWYHNEQVAGCEDTHLTFPQIGVMLSYDNGLHWYDLGIVLSAPGNSLTCETQNFYFAGGNGDFSVVLDESKEYFYFIFGAYHQQLEEQGICLARMLRTDRYAPVGKVRKWHAGEWNEPGLGGRVTPMLGVAQDWHSLQPDAFWGAAVHYNTHLQQYVMLLNRAVAPFWAQEGVYLSYNPDIANPAGWSAPQRLEIDAQGRAYPELIGLQPGETDKRLGKFGRLFLLGESWLEIEFMRPDEQPVRVPPRRSSDGSRNMPTRKSDN